jgi:cytochrome c oxidase assembly protein subunit 16
VSLGRQWGCREARGHVAQNDDKVEPDIISIQPLNFNRKCGRKAFPPHVRKMAKFQSNKYSADSASKLRAAVKRHPFLLFGLPFVAIILTSSFMLTPVTALRYEKFDKKRRWTEKDKALSSTGLTRRKVDPREEYYVRFRIYVSRPIAGMRNELTIRHRG